MYEEMTLDTLMERMLSYVPDTMDKREGSIIYDALAPVAVEMANLYMEMDILLEETFADTASTQYLIRRCAERGIAMQPATAAIVEAIGTPDTIELVGKRFNYDAINFLATEKMDNGHYKMLCETAGEVGNIREGELFPIDNIPGLSSVKILALLVPGEEEESTEHLRQRYFDSFSSQSFGGNVADYKEKVLSLDGIGGVKVYPTWNGGGTVKLVIQNSEFGAPSQALIDSVQETMDPLTDSGKGLGLAPIGHKVTVSGVTADEITMTSTYTFAKNYVWDDVKELVEDAMSAYLKELNEQWQNEERLVVRISQVESRLLQIEGILDVANTKINNKAANYVAGADTVLLRGEIGHA